jgi:hypothetical protein
VFHSRGKHFQSTTSACLPDHLHRVHTRPQALQPQLINQLFQPNTHGILLAVRTTPQMSRMRASSVEARDDPANPKERGERRKAHSFFKILCNPIYQAVMQRCVKSRLCRFPRHQVYLLRCNLAHTLSSRKVCLAALRRLGVLNAVTLLAVVFRTQSMIVSPCRRGL